MPPARIAAAAGMAALSLALCGQAIAQKPAIPNSADKPAPRAPAPPRIEGTVRDAAGKAIEKALVLVRLLAADRFTRTLTTRTDASGRFAVEVSRPGAYFLRVEAPGLAPHTVERLAVPTAALAVTLRKGAVLEGVVRDARGKPVAGARVDARAPQRLGTLASEPQAGLVRATTSAAGAFRLEGLATAAYSVTASAPGIGGVRRQGVTPGTKLELYLTAGAGVRGTVRSPDRRPLAGATVLIEPEAIGGVTPFVERTDDAGTFLVWGLAPGAWHAIAVHPDFAPVLAPLALEKSVEQRLDLTLGPPTRARGRLVDASERPVRGTLVVQELDGRVVAQALSDVLRADSDAQGRFTLERLPRAALALAVTARGHSSKRVEAVPDAAEVDLGDIVLDDGLVLRGRVRDAAGHGMADAQVRAMNQGMVPRFSLLEAVTEADGTFVLAGAEPGMYRVTAQASGFAGGSARAAAGGEPVEIVLPPAGSITGTVVDEKGAPVPAFDVTASPAVEREDVHQAADEGSEGRFELADVAAGEWVVVVKAPQKAEARVSGVKVRTGVATDVGRVRLTPGAPVRGRVTDSAGSAVAGASVRVEAGERDRSYVRPGAEGAFTDAAGAFELLGVAPGRVDVLATHPEFAPGRASGVDVDATRGVAGDVRITLSRGGRVEGTARRRDGRPIEHAVVRVIGIASWIQPVALAPDGTFALEHLPAGSMRVVLFAGANDAALSGSQQRPIEVREGETVVVDFVLRDILVSGTVTRRGEPAAGLRIQLRGQRSMFFAGGPAGLIVPAPPTGPQRGWALTRQDGSYELLVDEPGSYLAGVTSADGRASYPTRTIEVPDADATTADLAFGGIGLAGQVVDAETSAPVAAEVFASPKGENRRPAYVSAGADGRFQMEVDPGDVELRAMAEGYASASTTVSVGENGLADVRLALSRGGSISGRIADATGRPVPSLMVTASPEGTLPSGTPPQSRMGITRAAADGTFTITSLAEGRYAVSAGDELSGFGTTPDVPIGATGIVLRLSPGGRVRAAAVRADGSPASTVFVSVTKVDGRAAMGGRGGGITDGAGVVEFAVPPGSLELRAMDVQEEGFANASVAPGETAAVEIRLAPRKKDPAPR